MLSRKHAKRVLSQHCYALKSIEDKSPLSALSDLLKIVQSWVFSSHKNSFYDKLNISAKKMLQYQKLVS